MLLFWFTAFSNFAYCNISILMNTVFKIKHFNVIRGIKNKINYPIFLPSSILSL